MAAGENGRMPNCLSKEENDLNSVNKFLQNDYLGLIVRLTIGVIFIYASIDKIGAPAQFARIVYNYHFLPGSLINFSINQTASSNLFFSISHSPSLTISSLI